MHNVESIFHQKRPDAIFPCDHCLGLSDHEPWCIMRDPKVQYAYAIVDDPCALTYKDSLILHSLGVAWRTVIHPVSSQG